VYDVDMESEKTDKSQFNATFQGSSEKPEFVWDFPLCLTLIFL